MQTEQLADVMIGLGECHVLAFSERAVSLEQSVNYLFGDEIVLHVLIQAESHHIIVNNCRAGVWQEQSVIHVPMTEALPLRVALLFQEGEVQVTFLGARATRRITREVSLVELPLEISRGDMVEIQHLTAPARIPIQSGVLDFCGQFAGGVTVLCGWISQPWPDAQKISVTLTVNNEEVEATAESLLYERPDLEGMGVGYILFFNIPETAVLDRAALESVLLVRDFWGQRLAPHPQTIIAEAEAARGWMAEILPRIRKGKIAALRELISRPTFSGVDTLATLPVPCHLEADMVYEVPGQGLIISGWMLDPTSAIGSIRLSCRRSQDPEDLRLRWLQIDRPDVRDAFAARYDLVESRLGFVAFSPLKVRAGSTVHAEIELHSGEIGFKPLPPVSSADLPAIRRILQSVRMTGDELQPAFDRVLGAPLVAINRMRLGRPMAVGEVRFGAVPETPRTSIVVPLYGRLDFVEYQCALFSEGGIEQDELIYVLDEPTRKAELLDLVHGCHAKYGVPVRVVLPQENRGFGPASNLGLERAQGRNVCFLNSDIFPQDRSWLDRLSGTLEADPGIGVVGALCLFADGSIQHAGMDYEVVSRFGGWMFPKHPGKGMRFHPTAERLRDVPGITGACMVLRRELANELGGFDPDYVIGDFEDADLCNRIKDRGLRCVLDQEVVLYHLERQSQGNQAADWRMNLTLLNAWTFNQRWM